MALAPLDHLRLLRVQLDDREAELCSELRTLDDELERNSDSATSDLADEGERRIRITERRAEHDRAIAELRDIFEAKSRMANGQYGACADCGVEIPPARLEARPAALRCTACQERFDASHPASDPLPPMQ
jgi:RNA polymerase-binding transcription factor DksA